MITIGLGVAGLLYSLFLGLYANRIFSFEGRNPNYTPEKRPGLTWRIFQFWLNFSCCALGWAISIIYARRILACPSQFSFKVEDAVPLIIALLGITGMLPRTLFFAKVPWKGGD